MQVKSILLILICHCLTVTTVMAQYSNNDLGAVLFGETYFLKPKDSIRFRLWQSPFEMRKNESSTIDSLIRYDNPHFFKGTFNPKSRDFSLDIPAHQLPAWISFEDPIDGFSYGPYLLSRGDSIKIKFDQINQQVLFAGPSRHSFEMVSQMNALIERSIFESPAMLDFSVSGMPGQEALEIIRDNNLKFRRKVIPIHQRTGRIDMMKSNLGPLRSDEFGFLQEYYKSKVPEHVFNAVMADTYSKVHYKNMYSFNNYNIKDILDNAPELLGEFAKAFDEMEQEIERFSRQFDPSLSPNYLKMQEYRMRSKATLTGRSVLEVSGEVEPETALREAVLTSYFLDKNVLVAIGVKDFGTFLSELENREFRELLEPWYIAASPGLPVPSFPFLDRHGNEVSMTDFSGRVVLLETWLAGCAACKFFTETQMDRLAEKYRNDPEVAFVSVSLDRKRELWDRHRDSGIFVSKDMLHLWTGREDRASEHPYLSYFNITSAPQLQLIDKNGKLTGLGISDRTCEGISAEIEKLKIR
ncbi:TlpA family protein disulfide reductase [Aquiflexum sp.]|uniref:TlpA family protein disulfide reductase n=1 Tax=Aquiflexum sp. TaxID=1872584 RepID=UPI0035949234